MKKIIIVLIICLGLWATFDFIQSGEESIPAEQEKSVELDKSPDLTGLKVGEKAPNLELTTLNGEEIKLSQFIGKPIVLNFFATWCPPCNDEMPEIEDFYKEKEAIVLGVNLLKTEKDDLVVRNFIEKYNLTFPILLDEQGKASNNYMIKALPTTYLIDSEGKIAFRFFGGLNFDMLNAEFSKIS